MAGQAERVVRILVVDYDASTRRLLSAALSSGDLYQVVTVRNAAEALAALQGGPGFDLLLTDLALPRMSGMELVRRVRQAGSGIPIIVLTSVLTDGSIAGALEAGADDYLQKPVDLHSLRAAVADLLDIYRGRKIAVPTGGSSPQQAGKAAGTAVRHLAEGTFVELVAPTSTAQAERFQRFAERVLPASLSEKERSELRLALEEIVRNAIEWGNQNNPAKVMRLSYCLLPDRITFRIEDQGGGFDAASLKDPSLDPAAHIQERRISGKRMGGWGIFLARKMVDEVAFNERGNVVFLTKRFAHSAPLVAGDRDAPREGAAPAKRRRGTTTLFRKGARLIRR